MALIATQRLHKRLLQRTRQLLALTRLRFQLPQ